MEIFHMSDVVSLLGIPMPPSGRSSYYVQCPCCDENPRKKHLNINLKKKCIAARGAEYLVVYLICTHYIPGFRVTKCEKLWWRNWECLITGLNPKRGYSRRQSLNAQ
ncbi:hypothetical protein LC724_18160 [Blautia sp. RD014234]|nr:hypothetical protein [Blautia parvula]